MVLARWLVLEVVSGWGNGVVFVFGIGVFLVVVLVVFVGLFRRVCAVIRGLFLLLTVLNVRLEQIGNVSNVLRLELLFV